MKEEYIEKKNKKTIEYIVQDEKCMSCGACSGCCPKNAIQMIYIDTEGLYRPRIQNKQCVKCGMCLKCCPATEYPKNESVMGEYTELLLAHSTNNSVRHWATSGGVINEIVRYLLDQEIVDRVLMAGYDKNSRIETSGFWITKYNDLAENPRNYASRYVIAPILEKLKDYSNKEKIAVVGTPCQIRAISNWGGIQNNKVFRIGITCSGGMSYKATEQYKQIQHCKTGKMYYRGDGWPGKNSLQENEMTIEFDHLGSLFEVLFSSQIFKNPACRECHDHFAEYADISLCDFWNSEERIKEKEGNSCVIVRSEQAKKVVDQMIKSSRIAVVRTLKEKEIVQTQLQVLKIKKGKTRNKFPYKCFTKLIDNIYRHGIYKRFGYKTYMKICRVYGKICSKYTL